MFIFLCIVIGNLAFALRGGGVIVTIQSGYEDVVVCSACSQ